MKLNITIDIPDSEIARILKLVTPAPLTLELGVGGAYLDRSGKRHALERYDHSDDTFVDSEGYWYNSNGVQCGGESGDSGTLIQCVS